MPLLTYTKAAQLAGVSEKTIRRKVKSGDLSATTGRDGRRGIDPAELVRVFPDAQESGQRPGAIPGQRPGTTGQEADLGPDRAELDRLRQRVEILEAERRGLEERLKGLEQDKLWLQGQVQQLLPPPPQSLLKRLAAALSRFRGGG